MARCPQKFLPQTYTTVADYQEKKGSVRTKIIAVIYTKLWQTESPRGGHWVKERLGEGGDWENILLISFFLASSIFLLPSEAIFLLINWMEQHSAMEWRLQA